MSASFALKANRLANSSLGDVAFGGEDYNYRYGAVRTANGVWLNGAHQVFLSEFDCRTKGDGIRVNAIDLSSCNDLYIDQGLSSGNGACGLRCAGGFGGLYLDQVVLLANAEANLIVDSSEAHRIEDPNNRNNREIILGANTVCDGNSWRTPHCIVLDDANANGSGLVCHGYVGSAGQHGVYVKRWANSSVVLAAGRNYNNHGSAVVVDDERCRLVIGSGVSLDNNREPIRNAGGWGGGEWTRVPVRVSATQGRFYSADATVRYSVTGSTVHFTGVVNITINGSAAGGVVITLPVRAFADGSFPAVCTGRADAVSGVMLQGVIRGDSLILLSYDNSYPGGDGERLVFGGTYEVASLNW